MAETNTTTQKAVSLESLTEASKLIATKAEVQQQISDAVANPAGITFATTEEVLALFRKDAAGANTPESDPSESGT